MKKQKIAVIIGTRPEIIRLSLIIEKLKEHAQVEVVYTNQNQQYYMKDYFFQSLSVHPDYEFEVSNASFGEQISDIIRQAEVYFNKNKPDKVVILGDTNSGICTYVAERMGIPTFHVEAGNRCFSDQAPEEINRKLIDHVSSFNLPYINISRQNLIDEGIDKNRIFQCGNPIYEIMQQFDHRSLVLSELDLTDKNYILATIHRSETVDNQDKLKEVILGISSVAVELNMQVIFSVHPRTQSRIESLSENCIGLNVDSIHFHKPFEFSQFLTLEENAKLILTDSGTVSEEACLFGTPAIIVRDFTERPELLLCGSAVLSGVDHEKIVQSAKLMLGKKGWEVPNGYRDEKVSDKIAQYILTTWK